MAKKTFPILYKKSASGAIQQWAIDVEHSTIVTTYGQVGGKIQTTTDSVKSGKNLGRKNATDQESQALSEAKSQWLKKKKAGYVESLKDAESGAVDKVIEGGILPMLAKVFEDHSSKIVYPVTVQPKLDGHRCIAIVDSLGEVSLWSRTRKRITSVPHIEKAIKDLGLVSTILDGEIYSDKLKSDFEKITSAARKQEATEESKHLEYHVYDTPMPHCFTKRFSFLITVFPIQRGPLKLVSSTMARSKEEVLKWHDYFIDGGYEGTMVRLHNMPYESKRSSQLLKLKSFTDSEFKIVGVEEGRGKLSGHAGAFICETADGKSTFNVKMEGSLSKLKEYWENRDEYIGQLITVKYQGLTVYGIPRFPTGKAIREDL